MGIDVGVLGTDGVAETVGVFFQDVAQELVAVGQHLLNPFGGGFVIETIEKAPETIRDFADIVKEKGTCLCYCLVI